MPTNNEAPPRHSFRLRFINAGNRHAELEKELGCKPTYSHLKGDMLDEFLPDRVWESDSWVVEAPLGPDASTSEQLASLLSLIEKHHGFIAHLANSGVMIQVQCILFLSEQSIEIPASAMATLAKSDIQLVIQNYPGVVASITSKLRCDSDQSSLRD